MIAQGKRSEQGAITTFGQNIQTEETPDKRSLKGLEVDINAGLGDWDAKFKFKVTPLSETEVVTAMLGYDVFDETLKSNQSATSYGQGFQRHEHPPRVDGRPPTAPAARERDHAVDRRIAAGEPCKFRQQRLHRLRGGILVGDDRPGEAWPRLPKSYPAVTRWQRSRFPSRTLFPSRCELRPSDRAAA